MSDTKADLIKRLPKYVMLAHGRYDQNPRRFVVPPNTVYIFASRASRYLPQSIVDLKFYKFFSDPTLRKAEPDVLKGWKKRVYGPGDVFDDIRISFEDPMWPGMGLHKVPIYPGRFRYSPGGKFHGQDRNLSSLPLAPGVYFIVSCRAIWDQSLRYMNQRSNYLFSRGSTHERIGSQNVASSRLQKRRTPQTTLRKSNEPPAKRIKLTFPVRRKVRRTKNLAGTPLWKIRLAKSRGRSTSKTSSKTLK